MGKLKSRGIKQPGKAPKEMISKKYLVNIIVLGNTTQKNLKPMWTLIARYLLHKQKGPQNYKA